MQQSPSREFHLSLLALVAFHFLPHLEEHFVIAISFLSVCLIWRLAYEFQKVRLPKWYEKIFLLLFLFAAIYLIYGEFRGIEASTAALLGAIALKMLDNVRYRDAMILLLSNYLLLISAFLVSQSLAMTLFAGLACVLITALSFQLHRGKDMNFRFWKLLLTGTKVLLSISPLLILLFFVFPRFSTGLLGGVGTQSAKSGFGDDIKPGGIGKLILSNELAFRVEFFNKELSPGNMYWRGASYSLNQGLEWKRQEEFDEIKTYNLSRSKEADYEILLEPIFGNWIFLLDTPDQLLLNDWRYYRGIKQSNSKTFQWKQAISQKLLYKASYTDKFPENLDEKYLEKYLKIPEEYTGNAQILELNKRFSNAKSLDEFVEELYDWFQKDFKYSIDLEKRASKNLIDFLLVQKLGFCEHFAASMAFLARWNSYPSRVVAGFQGASKNSLSNHYVVRQRDAHAWVEIYDRTRGEWRRFDPTRVVAPLRFELGAQVFYSFTQEQIDANSSQDALLQLYNSNFALRMFRELQLYADYVSRTWNYFLLNYDFEAQKKLFLSFGLNLQSRKALWLMSVFVLLFFFLFLRYRSLTKMKKKLSYAQVLLVRLEKMLTKKQIHRSPSEAPVHFMNRASELLQNKDILEFSKAYANSQYSLNKPNKEDLKEKYSNIKLEEMD